ncbi:ATP synthase membrane subunit DAPIT, mitochondrial-like [Megalops cyprinoides]|uniref:ATP synthase membrane subunit DAPIT, mitochondrial-like n=1 Tax=Megalops cyprinoides TaxID=118141 RepID=UPI0018649AC1|nr:ATP synthase membrane subunit DAPIT, mitochondrial-like [Megalops cyprinoides]XP_036403268.1 ATP synthase membrane subunit DAPIT, mitochondrial-like [Megalops cyprinoides]
MAGHDAGTQHQFTGFAKHFNAYTITGRRNCVLATYAGIATIFLFFKLKPKKQKQVTAK